MAGLAMKPSPLLLILSAVATGEAASAAMSLRSRGSTGFADMRSVPFRGLHDRRSSDFMAQRNMAAIAQQNVASARVMRLRGGEHGISFQGAPPFVLACAFFAALDALLLGYDIGVVSGILSHVRREFALSTVQTEVFASAINGAAIVGALSSGFIADQFGRKPALFLSSLMFTTGSFLMSLAPTYRKLVFGRIIQGYGVGAGLLISPMFISEIAPPKFRGSLVTLSEVSLSLGVLLAFVVNFALGGHWRWMLALGAAPGVLLTLRILFLPESPRFLVSRGRTATARGVLRKTMQPQTEAALEAELVHMAARANEESGSWRLLVRKSTLVAVSVGIVLACLQALSVDAQITWTEMLDTSRGYAADFVVSMQPLATSTLVMLSSQIPLTAVGGGGGGALLPRAGSLCSCLPTRDSTPRRSHAVGIESIIYYSPIIFEKAGVATARMATAGTVCMGLIKLVFETYALLNVDRIGRRPLLLVGSAGLTLALLGLGTALHVRLASPAEGITAASVAVFCFIGLYMALHAISFGPMTWLILSEIFPASVRGKAMGIATTVNRATSFVVALTFLSLCERLNWGGSFYLYAGFAAFAFLFYALFVPETTGLKLEEIAPQFGEPRALVSKNVASLRAMLAAERV